MSEVQTRPPPSAPRGRGSSRGGRGGRGGARTSGSRSNNNLNGDAHDSIEDQGEVGQLKKQYAGQLAMMKEMFPHWSTEDLVYALDENNGDLETTAAKISEGSVPQWGEVKKKNKDRSRSKVKEPAAAGASKEDSFSSARPARGSRTAVDGTRGGGRGRGGYESRGGRGGRGRGGAPANGASRQNKDRPADNSVASTVGAWAENTANATEEAGSDWLTDAKNETDADVGTGWGAPESAPEKPAVKSAATPTPAVPTAPAVTKASWASLLKPVAPPPAPAQPKPVQKPAPPPVVPQEPAPEAKEPEPAEEAAPKEAPAEAPAEDVTPVVEETPPAAQPEPEPEVSEPVTETQESEPTLHPSLTEENLEKIETVAPPPPTDTQASTAGGTTIGQTPSSSSVVGATTPTTTATPGTPSKSVALPKATPVRPASFTRRVLDQQEAVVMPGGHAGVDRTALQFGSMGLNGDLDDDDEVEQAETVSQPPQPSPIAQPVTSLPPTGPSQVPVSQAPTTESLPTPRQAPGLPAQPQVPQQQPSPQPPLGPQSMTQHQLHPQIGNRYAGYGIPEPQQQQPQHNKYDSFGQPIQQSAHQPPTQPQQPQGQHQPSQAYGNYMPQVHQQQPSHIGIGVSSAPEQPPYNYYPDRSQPPGFGHYNASYMQAQQAQSQQEAGAAQQRASSGLSGAAEPSGQMPTSGPAPGQVQQPTSRYAGMHAAEQTSGHASPSPAMPTVQQTSQPHQQSMGQQYPMQYHPYYSQFVHQSYYGQPSPFGKTMYTYPQQGAYMSPQFSDHSSSPAGLGGYAVPSAPARDDYGRMTTSASQQSLPQHTTAAGYGNGIPNFLNPRGLPQDQQQLGGNVGQQVQQGQNDDALKFGENKPPTGPSSTPGLQGQPGRPGSATSGATGLGPQQTAQAPSAMYGSHLNHNLHGHHGQQPGFGGQGQGANQYSMYSGGYPSQYAQGGNRHGGGGGWSYH